MVLDTRETTLAQIKSFATRGTRDLRLLALTVFCVSFGFGMYFATFNNFAVNKLHITPQQLGYVEAIREMPGFLMVFVAILTTRIAEPVLASMAIGMLAMGLGAYYGVNSISSLILFSLVWSIGLHAWMPLQPSMAMNLAGKNAKGRRLGQLGSVGAFGTILGMLVVQLFGDRLGFHNIFIVAGSIAAIGAITVAFIRRDIGHAEKPRFVCKRRYSLYYLLVFLEGCRKQVFITFAIFALVKNYHVGLSLVALLMLINNGTNLALAPSVGRLIDRIGERKVLAFCYASLIPVFIGYATVKSVGLLCVLYCLDNLFYLGSMGLNTYLHKIADPADVTPSLTMGISINHAAAVVVPLIGGALWTRLGYQATFLGGTVVVAISVLAVLRMQVRSR